MSQVVATRSARASLLRPSSGSLQERTEKLKPPRFSSRVLLHDERRSSRGAAFGVSRITARRTLHAEPNIVPVSPEDVPMVCPEIKISCLSVMVTLLQ